MIVNVLDQSCYIGPQSLELEHVGVTPATHIAAIQFPNSAVPSRAYVKFCGPDTLDLDSRIVGTLTDTDLQIFEKRLFNEIIAYTLASYLNIKQPPRAAVILLPLDRFRKYGWPVPDWIPHNMDFIPAWCTEESPARSISYIYKTDEMVGNKYFNIFEKCRNWYSSVSAFDEWLANADRNGGNILKLSPTVFSIIDHGRLFDNLNLSSLGNIDLISRNIMREVIEKGSPVDNHLKLHNGMILSSERHSTAFSEAVTEITQWANNFKSIDKTSVLNFLQVRANDQWMNNRLGVI